MHTLTLCLACEIPFVPFASSESTCWDCQEAIYALNDIENFAFDFANDR